MVGLPFYLMGLGTMYRLPAQNIAARIDCPLAIEGSIDRTGALGHRLLEVVHHLSIISPWGKYVVDRVDLHVESLASLVPFYPY